MINSKFKCMAFALLCYLCSTLSVMAAGSDLIISEYVEGSSYNKALEIYNGTANPIDLSAGNYTVEMYFNGKTSPGRAIPLTGTIANNDVFVLAHASGTLGITPDQTDNGSWYNGNDAIVLKKNGVVIDAIGQIGVDPGSEWGSGLISTKDNTLRRMSTVCSGDTDPNDAFDPSAEWEGFVQNDFSNLGIYDGCGVPNTPTVAIYDLQGSGDSSPYADSVVVTTGVVTSSFQGPNQIGGFHIQDLNGDGNPSTSDGIFVYTNAYSPSIGDLIEIKGEVVEFYNLTELKNIASMNVLSSGNSISPVAVSLPITDFEPYEGMLVTFPQSLTVTENYNLGKYGEVVLSSGGKLKQPTDIVDPNDDPASGTNTSGNSNVAAVNALKDLNSTNRLVLDDASTVTNPSVVPYLDPAQNTLRNGSTIDNLTGVMDFAFGNYKLQPTTSPSFNYQSRPAKPSVGSSDLTVVSFNVLNYWNGDGMGGGFPTARGADTPSELARQTQKLVKAFSGLDADIAGLQEVENDGNGPNSAIAQLVAAINAEVGAGTYAYVNEPANVGSDAIKNAIIYKTSVVSPVGSAVIDDDDAYLVNGNDRRPIAQTFSVNGSGEILTVISAHFKSKSCRDAEGADTDQGDGQGCYNNRRKLIAQEVLNFISDLQTASGDDDVLLVGDLNSYGEEDPIDVLRAGGLTQLVDDDTYVFFGQFGQLDYAFATPSLASLVTGAAKWELNSAEPKIMDYNEENNPPALFAADPYRSSDHDPIIVGLSLPAQNFTLQLLHASDLEGGVEAIKRAPNFAAIVDKLEEEYDNTIILSAGDNYIPGPFFNASADRSLRTVFQGVYQDLFSEAGLTNIREGAGKSDISIMNIIGFDASAVGNHEFDATPDAFESIIEEDIRGASLSDVRWLGAEFPYLSSNLDFSADGDLGNLFTDSLMVNTAFQSASPLYDNNTPKLAPATLIKKNGELIGVVGATTQLLESISSNGGVKVIGGGSNDMVQLASLIQPVIDKLEAAGANKIILVSHLQQIALEQSLAPLLSGIDIIIAGGSDTILADDNDRLDSDDTATGTYPIVTANLDGDPALIVSTDGEYNYVGRLVVDFDANGVLVISSLDSAINGPYISDRTMVDALWSGAGDPFAPKTKGELVSRLTSAVEAVVIAKDSNIFGKTTVYLDGRRSEVRSEETNLGNLSADANLWVAQQYDGTVKASLKNGGGIRSAIGEVVEVSPGVYEFLPPQANPASGKKDTEVSQLDIENAMRFNNKLSILDLSAADMKAVLENGFSGVAPGSTPGSFPQISGMKVSYDATKAPGSRVVFLALTDGTGKITDVLVSDGQVQGDSERVIRTVTLNFLANGGDGYPFDSLAENRVDLDTAALDPGVATFTNAGSEQDALAEYLAYFHSTTPYNEGETEPSDDQRIFAFNSAACVGLSVESSINTKVYLGYKRKQCTTLRNSTTGGAGDYSYLWSNGATNPSTKVCPTETTGYTLKVTDARGCTSTASTTVCVENVICGVSDNPKENLISICFRYVNSSGKILHQQDYCLPESQFLKLTYKYIYDPQFRFRVGSCANLDVPCTSSTAERTGTADNASIRMNTADELLSHVYDNLSKSSLEIYPNPFQNTTKIGFSTELSTTIKVRVLDILGNEVDVLFDGNTQAGTNVSVEFNGSSLPGGIYIVQMVSDKGVLKTKKIVLRK